MEQRKAAEEAAKAAKKGEKRAKKEARRAEKAQRKAKKHGKEVPPSLHLLFNLCAHRRGLSWLQTGGSLLP